MGSALLGSVSKNTGGYFSCTMSLNLSTFEYKVDNIGYSRGSRLELIEKSQDIDVDTAITRLRPVPQVALKISRMINSDDYGLNEIVKEIRNDQIISSKVIQLCNSAFMGLKRKVVSVDQAIALMGEKTLLKLTYNLQWNYFTRILKKVTFLQKVACIIMQ